MATTPSMPPQTKAAPRPSGAAPRGAGESDPASGNAADINTRTKVNNDGLPRQPHERDEAPDDRRTTPSPEIEQAARDLAEGQVDTDARNMRGAEMTQEASRKTSDQAKVEPASRKAGDTATPVEKTRNRPARQR